MAGAALFIVAAAVVSYGRRRRYTALGRAAVRAGKHDVLQDRAVGVRNWRRGHRWWLLLAWLLALGCNFAVPVAGGLLLAGCGTGLALKAAWLGRRERAEDALLWVRVDWLAPNGGRPAGEGRQGVPQHGYRGGRRGPGRSAPPHRGTRLEQGLRVVRGHTSRSFSMARSWWRAIARLERLASRTR